MERFFNTAGPIIPEDHYHIPPLERLDLDGMLSLIRQKKYFILHAPRQTGKTSLLKALMTYLNNEGNYTCLYVNIEAAQAAREKVADAVQSILSELSGRATDYLEDTYIEKNRQRILKEEGPYNALATTLKLWAKHNKKPIILLIDEIDSLVGDTLISVLRQLRSGYDGRPEFFPQSIILCGVRDIRDYRIHSDKEKAVITGGSAFNIKAASLRLGNFSATDIRELYRQHTDQTGQPFHPDVFPLAWELTEGQPWLVNALAYEACFHMKECRDRSTPVTAEHILQAKENLILRRETHLDQLADKLREERVRNVILPLLAGETEADKIPMDDLDYVVDLGLVSKHGQIRVANRIYQEVIPRQLTYSAQLTINQDAQWYTQTDGRLDMPKLLTAFQEFFREHFESWIDGFDYAEAGAQLLLQAFLQRIVNGGGRVEREYGLGRKRTDLLVIWRHPKGTQKAVMELKIQHGTRETTIEKALPQTRQYMDKCGTTEGYLIIFDHTPDLPWEAKIFNEHRDYEGAQINVFGM